MATFYTEYQSVNTFFSANDSMGPDFLDLDLAFNPMDDFLSGPRTLDTVGDQTAQHRTGSVTEGGFVVVGSGLTGSTMTVNAVIYEPMTGGTLIMTSTGGLTLPVAADNPSGGSLNHMFFEKGVPEDDGHQLFDLNGVLSFSAGTLTVTSVHVESTIGEATVTGTVLGNFKLGEDSMGDTVILSGTVTGVSMDIDGVHFEGSGFSVLASTFFSVETLQNMEDLFVLMGSGNDVVTGGGGTGQTLRGYAGNDVLIAGNESTTFIGGAGNDIFDFNFFGDHSVVEDSIVGGGIDTIRTYSSYNLDGTNVERLVLLGVNSIDGDGNALVNVLTGNSGRNVLNGMGGADSLIGSGGNDDFRLDNAGDKIAAEAADDSFDSVYSTVNHILGANFEYLGMEGTAVTGTGNTTDNMIYANEVANVLGGLAGDDTIWGNGGADKIDGGDGADSIDGGGGANTLLGGGGNDTIATGQEGSTSDGGAGDDRIDGGEAVDLMSGGAGNDSLYGQNSDDRIDGGAGDDNIDGGTGADTMLGGAGNDQFEVRDVLDVATDTGGTQDWANVYTSGVTLGTGIEVFSMQVAGSGTGNALGNTFYGGDGTINAFFGGLGNDTYNLNDEGDSASEDSSGGGTDLVVFEGTSESVTLGAGIENLRLVGDSLMGFGNALGNVLSADPEGSNLLDGGTGNDTYNAFVNTGVVEDSTTGGGNDLVIASLEDGQSFSLDSDIERLTLVHIGEGTVYGYGGTNNNVITGANDANNVLYGGEGITTGADTLIGGALDDQLYGYDGADSLLGGAGNDWLDGGDGNDGVDTLVGGAGDDSFGRYLFADGLGNVSLVNDSMADSAGSDTVYLFGTGTDSMPSTFNLNLATQAGFSMIENINAGEANFQIRFNLTGTAGNNMLVGDDQADTLTGGAGNDTLVGGGGNDQLIGGLGNDSYVLDLINTIVAGETPTGGISVDTTDTVTDTGGNDVLVLEGGAGNSGVFQYTIGADTSSPFDGIDARGASDSVDFNLIGNAAGNVLMGGLAADTMGDTLTGGLGNDTYGVNVGDTVIEGTDSTGGAADLTIAYLTDGQTWDLTDGIENLTLVDISGDTTLFGNGNILANRITGDAHANNELYGGEGTAKDTLIGGAGNDFLEGGDGADSLIGGLGDDSYVMDFENKTGATAALPDMFLDTGGIDTLVLEGGVGVTLTHVLGATIENLNAVELSVTGTQKLTGNALDNSIRGSNGADSISGAAGADTLDGFMGADTLNGGAGNDVYVDGLGDDTYFISDADDGITDGPEGGGNDSVIVSVAGGHGALSLTGDNDFLENARFTGTGSVTISGNDSDNILVGNAGNDTIDGGFDENDDSGSHDMLDGGAGNDALDGGEGADTLTGGLGNDTLGGGYAESEGYGDSDGGDLLDGGAGNDNIDGGEGGADTLIGGDGNDTLYGGEDSGEAPPSDDSLSGGGGSDSMDGDEGYDSLVGGDGNDTMQGGDNGDDLFGNAGNDMLDGAEGYDSMDGGAGNDFLTGGGENDTMLGGDGADTLSGNGGDDTILGGAGNDVLDGGDVSMSGGADTLDGGLGSDTYFAQGVDDVITETMAGAAGGTDSVFAAVGDGNFFILGANIERLTLIGAGNATGNTLANVIVGAAVQSNELGGGGGNDTVTGGGGNDTFVLAHTTANNVMAIQDFNLLEGDKLKLDGEVFAGILAGDLVDGEIINGTLANATGTDPQLIYVYGTGVTAGQLYYDSNGATAGGAVLIATFAGGSKPIELTSDDFTTFAPPPPP